MYQYLAKMEPAAAKADAKPATAGAEGDGCTLTATAEHSGANKKDEPCNDGRNGK
jgi:pyruvate-ferredoxin/flavodoxin oxidoreductase